MKKLFCLALTLCLLTGFAALLPVGASSPIQPWHYEELAEVQAVLDEYNQIHGGSGELFAELCFYRPRGTQICVAITGQITGATKGLLLELNISIPFYWSATLTGNPTGGEPLLSIPNVVFETDAIIETDGIAVQTNFVRMDGGAVTGKPAIVSSEFLSIFGGDVTGDLYSDYSIYIDGGTVNGSLNASRAFVFGGTVNAPLITAHTLEIESDAQVFVDEMRVYSVSIAPSATLTINDSNDDNTTHQPIHPPDTGEGNALLFAVLLLMMLSGAGLWVLLKKGRQIARTTCPPA